MTIRCGLLFVGVYGCVYVNSETFRFVYIAVLVDYIHIPTKTDNHTSKRRATELRKEEDVSFVVMIRRAEGLVDSRCGCGLIFKKPFRRCGCRSHLFGDQRCY